MSGREFPIMQSQCRTAIPWALIEPHRLQAERNHHQTLERLAERGGLSPNEAVAVLEDRRWRPARISDAEFRLEQLLAPTPNPKEGT